VRGEGDPLGFMEPGFTDVLRAQVEEVVEERSAEAVEALEKRQREMVDEYRAEVEAQGRSVVEEVTRDGERSAATAEAAADRALDRLRAAKAEAAEAEAFLAAAKARQEGMGGAASTPSSSSPSHASDGELSDADRLESVKAGVLCGAVGVLTAAPLTLSVGGAAGGDVLYTVLLPLASAALTAALFGIVLRYAVAGGPPNNTHLPWGVVGAFALTQGLAYVQGYLAGNPGAGPAEGASFVANVVEAFLLFSIVSLALARFTDAGLVAEARGRNTPPE